MKAKSTYIHKMLVSELRLIHVHIKACQSLYSYDSQIICVLLCIETSSEMLQYLQESFEL